jgi:predicted Zn-dependent protease
MALAKRVGILAFVALISLGCLAGPEGRPRSPIPVPALPQTRSVFLAPIGDFPISDAEALVAHYQEKFGMTIAILPSLAVPGEAFDGDRKQLIAERVIDALGQGHAVATDPAAVVIGLTSTDMYIASESWAWAYGLRTQGHLAVVSTARMADFLGIQRMRRLQKLVTKNIGLLYFGLPLNDDPGSVLYRDVGGQSDLDAMSEDF